VSHYSIKPVLNILPIGLCLAGFLCNAAGQQVATDGPGADSKRAETSNRRNPIPDISVTDENGNARHFYSDLVKGKVVAINFVYTTCSTICPPLGATFGKLQKSLGAHFGRDIFLISISVDPATDTPMRLHSWAAQFSAKPGWTLVTGDKLELNRLLKALGSDVASPESHSPMVLIIDDKTGLWKRVYGLGSTAALTRSIEQIMTASAVSSSQKAP
jgi:protein SCO1